MEQILNYYVPGPEYPEYLAPSDEEVPIEDQPYVVADSPVALSPGYVADSDPEEDPEEDSEDGPVDYPADGGDGDDDDSSDDDEEEEEASEEEEAEEEHLVPTIVPFSQTRLRMARKTVRPEPPMSPSMEARIAEYAVAPTPNPFTITNSPLIPPWSSILPPDSYHQFIYHLLPSSQLPPLPSSPLPPYHHHTYHLLTIITTTTSTIITTTTTTRLIVHNTSRTDGRISRRFRTTHLIRGPSGRSFRVGLWVLSATSGIAGMPDDRDRGTVGSMGSRDTWVTKRGDYRGFIDSSSVHRFITQGQLANGSRRDSRALSKLKSKIRRRMPLRAPNNMPPKRTARTIRTARVAAATATAAAATTATATAAAAPMTTAAIEQLVADRVSAALANHETLQNSTNGHGDGSHNSGTGTRGATRTPRECTYKDFLKGLPENQVKFATCTFIGNALTWWNSHKKAVTQDVAYAMDWKALKKLMTVKYCPRGEIKKLEIELWNLKVKGTDIPSYTLRFQELALMCGRMFPEESDEVEKYVSGLPDMIRGNVMSYRPQTMEEVIEFANDQMNQKLITISERQAEQKRKIEFNAGNNQGYQQQNKRQNTGRAYTAGTSEKREYTGSLPLCTKCNYHHKGPCAPVGHFKRDCPKLKNGNRGNQRGNDNAPAKVYVVGNAGTNPDSNVVTGTFLLNDRYASILFDTGADRSFVSTTFSSLIDITPTTLDHYYDVELADGKIIGINTIIRGCTLNFLNHPFNINLLPVELGSFDVIIGMDWLSKYHAVIDCGKIGLYSWGNETLIIHGDGSNQGNGTRLNIISCTKTHKYLLKGHHVFLASITAKETEDGSGERTRGCYLCPKDFPENKKEHEEHLKAILELLKKEELYAKFSKCEFWIPKVYIYPVTCDSMSRDEYEAKSVGWSCLVISIVRFVITGGKQNVVADALRRKGPRPQKPEISRRRRRGELVAMLMEILDRDHARVPQIKILCPSSGPTHKFLQYLRQCEKEMDSMETAARLYIKEVVVSMVVPLEGLHIDDKLQFVEEPVEIMEREIKRLKRSRIPLVKVRWNSRRGPEFTWEREDSFKKDIPTFFAIGIYHYNVLST
ncbi:putative reverse transcriptase domain-containing protein [Tanacetum coccineum]